MDMDTPKFTVPNSLAVSSATSATMVMATISDKGEVAIDWKRVEEAAAGHDGYLRPIAQALIAVRDKTYKTLPVAP